MQVLFKRWCLAPDQHGQPVSINPKDVVATEFAEPAHKPRWEGDFDLPEATRIVMRKGKEFWVQGSVAEVSQALNAAEKADL